MMSDLRELYQEIILDHGRRPRNHGTLPDASHKADGHNPLCGDRLKLSLIVRDGVVEDVKFEGVGCAISMAAASTLTEAVRGKSTTEVEALFANFHDLVTGKPVDVAGLGKLAAFGGVAEFPLRVKCATLAWHTMRAAIRGDMGTNTE